MSAKIGTPAERVARGVAWLDATVPEWWAKVELLGFNINSPCNCVLGQVFEPEDGEGTGFIAAKLQHTELYDGLNLADGNVCSRDEWFGFDFYDTYEDPDEPTKLQAEWTRVIAERQAGGAK